MKTCALIYNPNSGHILNKKNIKSYKSLIETHGYKVKVIGTEYRGHAKEIVSHLGYVDLVMSMGGDGTFNEIVYGNLQRKNQLLLAHIPVGTTNDIGVMFGYGKDIKLNIELCLNGVEKNIDIPVVNNRPFVYVAGFGKFMNIPYETSRLEKKKFGYLAYIYNGIKDYFSNTKWYNIKCEIDGKKIETPASLMLICSSTRIAGQNNLAKNVKLDDDKFEVILCSKKKRQEIITSIGKAVISPHPENVDGIMMFKASKLIVTFDEYQKKPWCIDGEKLEIRTKKYTIVNKTNIKLLIPKVNVDKLFINK